MKQDRRCLQVYRYGEKMWRLFSKNEQDTLPPTPDVQRAAVQLRMRALEGSDVYSVDTYAKRPLLEG